MAPDESSETTLPPTRAATPPAPSPTSAPDASLSPAERVAAQPNELGVIPILEYHLFTTDPAAEDQFTRTAGSAPSPPSATWDKVWIPRIQAFDDELGKWFPVFEDGGVILYTSDGSPDTITVPDPLPSWLDGTLDPDLIAASGKVLVPYDPETGRVGDGTTHAQAEWYRRETIFTG